MTGRKRSIRMRVGIAATAGVVLLASPAFACTVFKGKMEVKRSGASPTSSAQGDGGGMSHCANSIVDDATATSGNNIEVNVLPGNCTGSGTLPLDEYSVLFINTNGFVDSFGDWDYNDGSIDCMDTVNGPQGSSVYLVDADNGSGVHVDSAGYSLNGEPGDPGVGRGSRTYPLPTGLSTSGSAERAAVCLSDPTGGNANAVPLEII